MKQLTPQQCAALVVLQRHPDGILRQRLVKNHGVSGRTIRWLRDAGYVLELATEEVRNPRLFLTPEGLSAMRVRRLPTGTDL